MITAPTVRIPLGYLVLEDDSRFTSDSDCVVGRLPEESNAVRQGFRPVRIDGLTSGMSRVHIEIRRLNAQLYVVDLGSKNGVLVREPDARDWTRLTPWRPALWCPGADVRLGCRTLPLER